MFAFIKSTSIKKNQRDSSALRWVTVGICVPLKGSGTKCEGCKITCPKGLSCLWFCPAQRQGDLA